MSTLPWQNFRCGKTGIAVNGALRPIHPRNTPICSSHTSNSRSRENRRWRSSDGKDTMVKSMPFAFMVPSTKKRVRSYSLQDRLRHSGSIALFQLRFDLAQQEPRLFSGMIRRDARDDGCHSCLHVSFQHFHAVLRSVENREEMTELVFALFKEAFHPLPSFLFRPCLIVLNIERHI